MAFKAKLTVGGKEFNVLKVDYSLVQETDATGRPSYVSRGGKVNFKVESTDDTTLFEWMTNNFERRSGTLKFLKRDTDATSKELNFTEGYMVKYKEEFDSTGTNPFCESFTISAREISVGNGEHVNEWV